MAPQGVDGALRRKWRMTDMLAVLTTLAWLAAFLSRNAEWTVEQLGFVPARFAAPSAGYVIPAWLTPLSATFVHSGILHLVMNMAMLVYCGRAVEAALGRRALLIIYLVGAYGAALAQYLIDPGSIVPMVGASGAISAVLAVYAMLYGTSQTRSVGPVPAHVVRAVWLAAAWTALQWLVAIAFHNSPYAIATAAHVGGFLTGLLLNRPLLAWRYRTA